MRVIIDRIQGEFAVVLTEDGASIAVPKALFPTGNAGDTFVISRDDTKTAERGARIKNLMNEVWE